MRNSFKIWQRSSHAICKDNLWKSVMSVDPFVRKCLMSDTGIFFFFFFFSFLFFLKCQNRHFRGISFKTVLISTNCCITEQQTTAINTYTYTFSSNWPSWFCKVKHMGDSCNGVDRLVQCCRSLRNVRWTGTESQSRWLAFLWKVRHFTLHTLTGRSSKSLIVYKLYVNNLIGYIQANPRNFYR